jgi:hypothetical protein
MSRLADASRPDGFDAFARALQSIFPARNDAPLALTLLRLLSEGRPVTASALAQAAERTEAEVVRRLGGWPNVERDETGRIVAFSGLTLRPTAHAFTVGDRRLHTWCAWDTLFLPALLHETAHVRSTCPVTGSVVELVVAPDGVTSAPLVTCTCRSRLWRPRTLPTSPARSAVTSSSSPALKRHARGARRAPMTWSSTSTLRTSWAAAR